MDFISIKKIVSDNTIFTVIEKIPFEIKRVYSMMGMKENDTRGQHAHYKTRQYLICLQGKCTCLISNKKGKGKIERIGQEGILFEPWQWHSLYNFTKDCIILVLASEEYDENDYIRDYEQFKKTVYFNKD